MTTTEPVGYPHEVTDLDGPDVEAEQTPIPELDDDDLGGTD